MILVPLPRRAEPAPRARTTAVLFLMALACYASVGSVLVLGYDSIMEDALSRLSAASSVWSARDPKLAAIGFVWTPLPALVMTVFTPLRPLWPGLVATGYLAMLVSAVCAAAAVCVLHGILRDLRLRPSARLVLTALFAVQPLFAVYATNGMTETMLLASLLAATRALLRWLDTPDVTRLVAAGCWLGLGYLARYEAIVAAAAATVFVVVVTATRTRGTDRWPTVLVDALVVGLAPAAAFVLWAVTSWAVVGSPFEQFTSVYGNSALVAGAATTGAGLLAVGQQLLALAPAALPVALCVGLVAAGARDGRVLVPMTVFGSVLVFEWLLRASGDLFGFLRYQIAVIPLTVLLVALLVRRWRPIPGVLAPVVALGAAVATSGTLIVSDPVLASQEYLRIEPIVTGSADPGANGMWAGDRALAARLDTMDLPPGSVLADTGAAFALVAASRNPHQFVITSDDDFPAALADPPGHHVRYLLRNEHGAVDAVRATWPDLDRVGWARLDGGADPATRWSYTWTLWRVD